MRLNDENLRGRTIIAADGQVIGSITSLYLDIDEWRVESVHVKLRKEIADRVGADRGVFHAGEIDVPVRMIQAVGETVVLSASVDELRQPAAAPGEPAPAH